MECPSWMKSNTLKKEALIKVEKSLLHEVSFMQTVPRVFSLISNKLSANDKAIY